MAAAFPGHAPDRPGRGDTHTRAPRVERSGRTSYSITRDTASSIAKHPAQSGWIFSDGVVISATELERIDRVPPLVVSNACESGITPERSGERSAAQVPSFAESFFAQGVANYVGTAWPVDDMAARLFATTLYSSLIGLDVEPDGELQTVRSPRRQDPQAAARSTWRCYALGWLSRTPSAAAVPGRLPALREPPLPNPFDRQEPLTSRAAIDRVRVAERNDLPETPARPRLARQLAGLQSVGLPQPRGDWTRRDRSPDCGHDPDHDPRQQTCPRRR